MSSIGVTGDRIRVGNCLAVRITAINENTGAITLGSPCNWSDNEPVYWSPNGLTFTGLAPDAGALEFGAGGISPSPPSNLVIIR